MKRFALVTCFSFLALTCMSAQEGSKVGFNLGAGFTTPVGNTGRHLDPGWNLRAGVGYNFSPHVGLMVDLGYDSFGINSATLSNIGAPGGSLNVFSATLDPIVHLNPRGHVDVYLTGGMGLFHRYQEFTRPDVAVVTGFDPFFGFYPVAVPVNNVLASYSVNKLGVDAGMGVAFGTKWHGKIFAEAKYNRIFMGNYLHTDYVPVTFGFRW